MRDRINLNGIWEWARRGHESENKTVPGSYLCVGSAVYERKFDLKAAGEKIFLIIEGINYSSHIQINGRTVAEKLLPYTHYELDVTKAVSRGTNNISVFVEDTQVDFGPSRGWENWAGIIRDIYLEKRDPDHIKDICFRQKLARDFKSAKCSLKLTFDRKLPVNSEVNIKLSGADTGKPVMSLKIKANGKNKTIKWGTKKPRLWSPETPHLYKLDIMLKTGNRITDRKEIQIGFKKFACAGRNFELNGKRIFLKGVCRHDVYFEQGFTLTKEQMKKDMRLIKQLGCNFIRLVHYPHHPYILELADKMGFLVTGEPGIWGDKLTDKKVSVNAVKILERLIERDKNHVSIFAWILGNESVLIQSYLTGVAKRIRSLDPGRLVSFANCKDAKGAKKMFSKAKLDFYTQHPYGMTPELSQEVAEIYNDKPLLFTEWGGSFLINSPNTFETYKLAYIDLMKKEKLAGISFWCFADYRQYERGCPACYKGAVREGLLDEKRRKRPEYLFMKGMFLELESGKPVVSLEPPEKFDPYLNAGPDSKYRPITLEKYLDEKTQAEAWKECSKRTDRFLYGQNSWREPLLEKKGKLKFGALEFLLPEKGRPLCIERETPAVIIKINRICKKIHFLGQVTTITGYPSEGKYGKVVAKYRINMKDGKYLDRLLKQGEDLVEDNMLRGASRIDARPANAPVAYRWWRDTENAYFQACCLAIELKKSPVAVKNIEFRLLDDRFCPLLYAVTLEE